MATFVETTIFAVIYCAQCGMPFGVAEDYQRRRREDHVDFSCPNGHINVYSGPSDAEKLREQLATKERELAAAKSRVETERQWRVDADARTAKVQRSLTATKAVVTRTKKKIVAGRCPCCSHKFKDLAIHMKTEHPAYDPEKAASAIEAKAV